MKRFITIAISLALLGSTLFYFIRGREQGNPARALASFAEGDFASAEHILANSKQVTFPLALYHSYLATAKGRFKESDHFLQRVLRECSQSHSDELLVQSYLTSAINAYFENRDQEISPLIESAKNHSSRGGVLHFFEGLSHYLQRHYTDAREFWSSYGEERSWIGAMIDHCFPISWRQLHVAHCMTEEGDILGGREILEKESHFLESDPQNFRQLAVLLLGLTYLKEAHEAPLSARASYYKLARFYFERSGREMRFDRERLRVSEHVSEEARTLLCTNTPQEMKGWGLAFVETLEEWNALDHIEEIASALVHSILERRDNAYLPLCKEIAQQLNGSYFHTLVNQNLLSALREGALAKESDTLHYVWVVLESLSENPKKAAREVALITKELLLDTIYEDAENLVDTRRLLAFWKRLGQGKGEQEKLGQELLSYGQLFWKKEGFEERGTRLLRLAVDYCVDKQLCQSKIEHFLSDLYASAESCNMIQRLSLIHDALDYFHVTIKEIASSEKLANHLADAEYLYNARNWGAAKTHAGWVLKLDPTNHRAQRLVGLACFHMGEYTKALHHLAALPVKDENVHKALAFSSVYCSQEKTEHLVQIDNIDTFDEDD